MQTERFARFVTVAQGLIQRLDVGVAAQLSGRVEHVVLTLAGAPATAAEMADGVERQVTNGHFLADGPSPAIEPQGNDEAVLEQFLGIVCPDHGNQLRDGGAQARFEFKQELCFSFTVHERFWCGGWKRKKPQPVKVGWGFLNEVGGLTRTGDRQASKPWEREKVSRGVGQRDNAVRPPGNAGSERCERGCFRHGYITRSWRALRWGSQGPWRRSE